MSGLLVTALGGLGVLVGAVSMIAIERVPERAPLLRPPFPEVAAGLRTTTGLLVALGTGALFAAIAVRFDEAWELPAFLLLATSLVVLSVIDLRLFILPNRIVGPLAVATAVLLAAAAALNDDWDALGGSAIGGVSAFAAFLVLHLVSPRSMGFGDVKLVFVLGLALGWLGGWEVVLGLFLGFVYGAVVGVVLIATGVRSRRDHVPFGPFLAAGTLTAILVGTEIISWYRR